MKDAILLAVRPVIRHGITVVAGALMAKGVFPNSAEQNSWVELCLGAAMTGVALAWSYAEKRIKAQQAAPPEQRNANP